MPNPVGPAFRGRSGRYFQEVEGPGGSWLTLFACIVAGLFLLMGLVSGAHFLPGVIGRILVFLLSSVVLNLVLFAIHWAGLLVIAGGAVMVLWLTGALAIGALKQRVSRAQVVEVLAIAVPLAAFAVAHYLIYEQHGTGYVAAHATAFHTLVVRFEHMLALVVLPGALWVVGLWIADALRRADQIVDAGSDAE